MGGYSKGCFPCRRRKIKCDERKPTCSHCIRREDACRYQDPTAVAFRSMNSAIAARYGQRSTLTQPTPSWEQQAQMHFFHHYVVFPADHRRGYLEFLPSLLERNQDHSALKHAFAAASMAQLANMHNLTELSSTAQSHYGLALHEIARSMDDASTDCGLTSILLLQKYETICGLKNRTSDAHDIGLAHLVSERRRKGRPLPESGGLSFMINGRRHMSALDGTVAPGGSDAKVDGVFHAGAQLWALLGRSVEVCHRMRQLMILLTENTSTIANTWRETVDIYRQLRAWRQRVPIQANYTVVDSTDLQSEFLETHYKFHHLQHGVIWMGFWSSQIRFVQTMLSCADAFDLFAPTEIFEVPVEEVELRDTLLEAVDSICASSLYMTGELDGSGRQQSGTDSLAMGSFFLLRPLAVAIEVKDLSAAHRQWIIDRLWHIGHSKGIRQALRVRERWVPEGSAAVRVYG